MPPPFFYVIEMYVCVQLSCGPCRLNPTETRIGLAKWLLSNVSNGPNGSRISSASAERAR